MKKDRTRNDTFFQEKNSGRKEKEKTSLKRQRKSMETKNVDKKGKIKGVQRNKNILKRKKIE